MCAADSNPGFATVTGAENTALPLMSPMRTGVSLPVTHLQLWELIIKMCKIFQ